MAVYPSYVNLDVDGRSSIGTGPHAKTGGMTAAFHIRENGSSVKSVTVDIQSDGMNVYTTVTDPEGNTVYTSITKY